MKKSFIVLIFIIVLISSCASKSNLVQTVMISIDSESKKLCTYEDELDNDEAIGQISELVIASSNNDKSFDGSTASCVSQNAMAFEGRCCIPNFGDINEIKNYMGFVKILGEDKLGDDKNIISHGFQIGNYLVLTSHAVNSVENGEYIFERLDGEIIEFTVSNENKICGMHIRGDDNIMLGFLFETIYKENFEIYQILQGLKTTEEMKEEKGLVYPIITPTSEPFE